ncbi:MAG TPA: MoaF N-terminal domain-containing protein [Sphingobium sp.]|nr:MoaF N-terminal domain-containing protein [Sphingobium sp.]
MLELKPIEPVPPMARDMDLTKYRLPSTTVLGGETIVLAYDDGGTATFRLTETRVNWELATGDTVLTGEDDYDAVEVRPGLFFLHFAAAEANLGLSTVIDRDAGRAITVWNVPTETDGGWDLRRFLRPARVSGHETPYRPIARSRKLIGRRAYCIYSEEAALEHIYVNSSAIIWQWLLLPDNPRFAPLKTEVGIEAVTMWEVRDDMFLLVLRVPGPVQLTLLMDFEQMRNVGCLFGRTNAGLVDRLVGAKIVHLNDLTYPAGHGPG